LSENNYLSSVDTAGSLAELRIWELLHTSRYRYNNPLLF